MANKIIDSKTIKKIIISRTDNIGDVILTLPLAAILKQQMPQCEIIFLARHYVKAVIDANPYVDGFIDWEQLASLETGAISRYLAEQQADTILHVFPNAIIAKAAKQAKINNRIGTSRRWYHYLSCNHLVKFSRKYSQQHEAQLNLRLLAAFGLPYQYGLNDLASLIDLSIEQPLDAMLHQYLTDDKFTIVVHPGSNGNTHEWPVNQFRDCVNQLIGQNYRVLLTGSPQEAEKFHDSLITHCPEAINLMGKLTLQQLIQLIANVDGIIASSTGPLHIGAGLGINALGLFPPCPGKDPGRWAPVGKNADYLVAKRLCVDCKTNVDCKVMHNISIAAVLEKVKHWEKLA